MRRSLPDDGRLGGCDVGVRIGSSRSQPVGVSGLVQDSKRERWRHQRLRGADKGDHLVEPDDDVVVALAGLDEAVHVAVEEVGREGLLALGVGIGEVAADGDRPWAVDDPSDGPEVLPSKGPVDGADAVERGAERVGLLGG